MANFPDSTLTVNLQPSVQSAIQDRTLQRVFRDALFPRLLYRMESVPELWPANLGANQTFTRAGLIRPSTRPLKANTDPTPKGYDIEQWEATAQQWGDTIDTHMPTSYTTLASQYLRNMHQLGMQAGQSLNRIVRDKLFNAYTAGNTVATASAASTTIKVAHLNGFTKQFVNGRLAAVSASNPLQITTGPSSAPTNTAQVIGFTPDFTGDEIHSGTLTLSAALGTAIAARDPVLAINRTGITYVGGGDSVDAITSARQLNLAGIRSAVAGLRFNNVPPHEDGTYHAHLDPIAESQIFGDNEFQRLNQSLPDYIHYRKMAVASLLGCTFYRNSEAPTTATIDDSPDTGFTTGFEAISAPVVGAAVKQHRTIVTGAGAVEEKYLDESRYISDAGVQGKIGEFAVVNGGIQIMTERIRLILRSPQDRLQQMTSSTWSFSGDFPVPSDALAKGSVAVFKRAAVVLSGE